MHNLPAALSSFVGRREEMVAVAKLLDGARLATLVGAAGVGKTRLAVAVAAAAAEPDFDGVWLIELAPVTDPCLVATAVAAALGVREQPGHLMLDTLISYLRDRRPLLILDNCEHVIGSAAELVETLLTACLDLRILATSREPLRVAGEATWPVPPLSVPPAPDPRGEDAGSIGSGLAAYEAVRLFADRVTARDPSFALSAAMAPAVAEICQRLDGMPLAIELAAARVSVLSPVEIAERLDDRFRLLTSGNRTAPSRHQSLQAALEWSYDLLCDPERVLLARVSVFAGGFTLGAAEDVCAGDCLEADRIIHLLADLVAKSLVVADTSGAQARYRLLETIRHYGADKLATFGETPFLGDRHAAYYTKLAEEAEPELIGPRQDDWMRRLDADHANLRVALRRTLTCGQPEQALRLSAALALFWSVRGYLSEGRAWLDQALVATPDACASLRAKALWALGWVAGSADEFADALVAGEESLTLYQELDDIRGMARALQLVGVCTLMYGSPEGRPLLNESMALARQVDDRWCLTRSLALLGIVALFRGELVAARTVLKECVPLARMGHDKLNLCLGLLGLGNVALGEGDQASAEVLLEEGLMVARALGLPRWESQVIILLGELARVRGDYARARTLWEEGLFLSRQGGSPWTTVVALTFLGRLARAGGDPDAASPLLTEALVLAQAAGSKSHAASVLLEMSELSRTLGDPEAARAHIDQALACARNIGMEHVIAQALYHRAQLARFEGDHHQAERSHHEAMRVWGQAGLPVRVVTSLEALGGLAAERGRGEHAARLLGAAHSFREAIGYVRFPDEQAAYDADVTAARRALSTEAFAAAWQQGGGMSLEEAVSYAAKGRGPRHRPATGWASLTRAEREVAVLAAEGLTNAEIGQRLFISPRTVKAHLAHIFAKLGITSRRHLREGAGQHRSGVDPLRGHVKVGRER